MSITTALFSDSQARLFRWLFGQPERSYHLSELRRLTALGSASLQRELNRLVDAGLVLSSRVGNLRRFQANPQSPVYAELIALTRKTLGAVPLLCEALQPVAARLETAFIYGSVAKQTDTAQSDIDLMLVGENLSLNEILTLLLPLETQLGRKINPNCYTQSEYARRLAEPDSFVNRVLAQPILTLIGKDLDPASNG
jgi:predicted nucleotidyltransferase